MGAFIEILNKIKKSFPDFEITEVMEGLPTVIFGFFTNYTIKAILAKDKNKIDQVVSLVNEVALSNDYTLVCCLDEFILCLYDSNEIDYKEFENLLSEPAKKSFKITISMWNKQND